MRSDASEFERPAAHFHRRAALYTQMDRRLWEKTRFFGAAAMTNKVLARLFEFHPTLISIESGRLLQTLGAGLEQFNLRLAGAIRPGDQSGGVLDRRLVQAEQRLAQVHWRGSCAVSADRKVVEGELNDLLNDSHVLCQFARFWKESRDYSRVLAAVRLRMKVRLDFGNESHRVDIGCALIDHLRHLQLNASLFQRGAVE
jgi:hypothetical protein